MYARRRALVQCIADDRHRSNMRQPLRPAMLSVMIVKKKKMVKRNEEEYHGDEDAELIPYPEAEGFEEQSPVLVYQDDFLPESNIHAIDQSVI